MQPHLCCVLILLSCAVPPQLAVHVAELHQHIAVRALHPGLLVEVGDVELAAGAVGQQLVMLLKDLVNTLQQARTRTTDTRPVRGRADGVSG